MNAHQNPFASRHVEALRFRLPAWSWEASLERLADLRYRAAVVGPQGSGKTTFLEQLAPRLTARGWVTHRLILREAEPHGPVLRRLPQTFGPRDFILLDGCEQLSGLGWQRFRRGTRRAGGLVVSLHRPGRLPTLFRCQTTPALLTELAAELLQQPAGTVQPIAEQLFARHSGNVRSALGEWYDLCACNIGTSLCAKQLGRKEEVLPVGTSPLDRSNKWTDNYFDFHPATKIK